MIAQETLVGNHPKFKKALSLAGNIAVTKAPALVTGELGTGKKAFCRFIHTNSMRSKGPIITVDCSQDAQNVENEILGYRDDVSGSFHKGALERANGGSVILANIDGLEEKFQVRLFTILQELGDYDLDVRVLATTSKNLSKYVGAGRFHRALYTYFSASQINLIPLRERDEDIRTIAQHFVESWCREKNVPSVGFTDEALDKIMSFYWTHNVAELSNVIENSMPNVVDGKIDVNAIELGEKKVESKAQEADEDGFRLMSLKEAEKLLIKKALIHTSENRTQAAKILGVSIRTLRNKINEYRSNGTNYFVNLR